jgi:crossover junction endodeoxyribonuclease RusA
MTLRFSLPYPPSVNTYWRHTVVGGKFKKSRASVFLSDAGKRYRTAAMYAMNVARVPRHALKGRLAVRIVAHPPDARVRDLDNLCKGVLDALVHNSVIIDDGHIDDLHLTRGAPMRDGSLDLAITEITPADLTRNVDMFHHREVASAKRLSEAVRVLDQPPF